MVPYMGLYRHYMHILLVLLFGLSDGGDSRAMHICKERTATCTFDDYLTASITGQVRRPDLAVDMMTQGSSRKPSCFTTG